VAALLAATAPARTIAQTTEEPDATEPGYTIISQEATPSGVNTTIQINISQDAFIASAFANTNFGGTGLLQLGWFAGNYEAARILIKFDTGPIPSNATINRATLYFFQSFAAPPGDRPMDFRAQYMNTDWSEGSVTWNNANYLGGDALPIGSLPSNLGWQTFDISNVIRTWNSGARPNYGLIVTGDETPSANRQRQYSSKEQGGQAPYVLVDFTVSCDTVPPNAFVEALPSFSPSQYRVSWTGTDAAPSGCAPSGIAHFDVDYRINAGSWQRWKNQTTANENTFKGWASNGDFVEFRARAADHAGNIQDFGGPQASTRVDTEPPVATVNPLPQFTTTPNFLLSWSGTDNLSGIATYDIQYREDGGDWKTLLEETTQTSYQVTGAKNGVLYELRSRATDNVGNTEDWGDEVQASTTVQLNAVAHVLPFQPNILKPTAPITDSFPVRWTGFFAPGTSIVRYDIYYQFNSGPWRLWQNFPGNQTSATFPYKALGLGDGFYGFQAVATNNLGVTEQLSQDAEATMIVDLADQFNPAAYLPTVSNMIVAR
jgi:hypothetical protein